MKGTSVLSGIGNPNKRMVKFMEYTIIEDPKCTSSYGGYRVNNGNVIMHPDLYKIFMEARTDEDKVNVILWFPCLAVYTQNQ